MQTDAKLFGLKQSEQRLLAVIVGITAPQLALNIVQNIAAFGLAFDSASLASFYGLSITGWFMTLIESIGAFGIGWLLAARPDLVRWAIGGYAAATLGYGTLVLVFDTAIEAMRSTPVALGNWAAAGPYWLHHTIVLCVLPAAAVLKANIHPSKASEGADS